MNKRIARELNVKKTQHGDHSSIFSDATEQTWDKVFPKAIRNKLGHQELAITYVLRHTFYTPRHVLDICDKILRHLGEKGHTLNSAADLSQYDWSIVFQEEVEEYSCSIVRSFITQYGHIYAGLESVLQAFAGCSVVWSRGALLSFVQKNDLTLTRSENGRVYAGDALLSKLQHIGFLGHGSKDWAATVGMTMRFKVRYAFLERLPSNRPWELAVVSPIFYDSYGMRSPDNTLVVPHEKLTLSHAAWQEVMRK